FLIETAAKLEAPPIIKYSALTLFAHRFFPYISTPSSSLQHRHFLLQNPLNYATLQLFALISLLISSKSHGYRQLRLKSLKSIGDDRIKDQHYTKTDYLDAEILFLQCVNFDIGTMKNSVFMTVEELLVRFKEVARVAEMVRVEVCIDVMDVLYESEAISRLFVEAPVCLAAAIVAASFVITVPKRSCEFPLVSWLRFATGCSEDDVLWIVELILEHIVKF
ncbi:cyclin-J18-like, partial [Silene latifolia]|uniref:cyclin-J18-like n=1 Tax=Silene latifolia TaxID=37657 RepID=UPI003D785C8C